MNTFGEILAELRKDRALNQKDFAAALHVSVGTISHYENGIHLPDVEKLIDIADFFGVSIDYLLGRSSNILPSSVFQEQYIPGKTTEAFIQGIMKLPTDQRQAMCLILDHLERLSTFVRQYNEGEKQ